MGKEGDVSELLVPGAVSESGSGRGPGSGPDGGGPDNNSSILVT